MFRFSQVKYHSILDIPELEINAGRITTLVGESGSGKTTLLRLLNKLISPTGGSISYQQQDLKKIDSVAHRRNVVMLPQSSIAFPGNVRDNLLYAFKVQGKDTPPDDVMQNLLEKLRLDKKLEDSAQKLSGGELQRLALGRVMLLDAPVYLLDEPSSSLDEKTEHFIFEQICQFVEAKEKTLIMVTHSRQVADDFSDDIIEIESGRINPLPLERRHA